MEKKRRRKTPPDCNRSRGISWRAKYERNAAQQPNMAQGIRASTCVVYGVRWPMIGRTKEHKRVTVWMRACYANHANQPNQTKPTEQLIEIANDTNRQFTVIYLHSLFSLFVPFIRLSMSLSLSLSLPLLMSLPLLLLAHQHSHIHAQKSSVCQ